MAETYFYREKKERDYTVLNNTVIRDTRISWKAKGVMVYLLSLPENWKIYITEVAKHATDGESALRTAIKELIDFGYIEYEQIRNEAGTFGACVYKIIESPYEEKPLAENPHTVKPNTENRALLNTNNNKILKEQNTNTHNSERADFSEVPSYIQEPVTNPSEFRGFLNECFMLIVKHNQSHGNLKKIPISTNMLMFSQKEGRRLVEIARYEKADRLLQALQNYLKVMDCDTWKRGFSFNAFCNNYQEYLPEYFSVEKYERNDVNPYAVCQDFITKELDKKPIRINVAVFVYHHKDWLKAGRPEGEQFYQLQAEWEKQDDLNNVDYPTVNAHIWEEYQK